MRDQVETKTPGTSDSIKKYQKDIIIKQEDGLKLAKRIKAFAFFECSCLTFENIEEIFQSAAIYFLNENNRNNANCCCFRFCPSKLCNLL